MVGTVGQRSWLAPNESSPWRGTSAQTSQGMAVRGEFFTTNPGVLFYIVKVLGVSVYKRRLTD